MKGYGQFCPVAKGAEVFAERWTPLVLRELLCGSMHFSDLHRGVPLMSRSLLSLRLKQLEEIGVVERKQGHRDRNTISRGPARNLRRSSACSANGASAGSAPSSTATISMSRC